MGAPRFVDTTREKPPNADSVVPCDPVLVIAHHPALARVGDVFVLRQRTVEISRLAPVFASASRTSEPDAPIDDPFVSRTAITFRRIDAPPGMSDVEIENPGVELAIAGVAMPAGVRRISSAELARGLDLVLGGRVVLWLTTTREHTGVSDELGMLGSTRALHELRMSIRALGIGDRSPARSSAVPSQAPILILGETGSGKELVARAIHASVRPDAAFVALNVAAIPAAVATAELFGHERGAFTGATERRAGHFERAANGVLFLDEIGDLPESVQPILLRVLESGEIQPVGGQPRRVDTLVVAATDTDLAAAAASGRYRAPLYHRLAAMTLRVPPLRERRGDIGLLLARFLMDELALGHAALDRTVDATPWLPATIVAELIRGSWPGNIRQLRAVALRLAAIARAGRTATLADLGADLGFDDLEREELGQAGAATSSKRGPTYPKLDDPSLLASLRAHGFHLARTAEALGISRTHLDALIAKSSTIRKAKDLAREEIVACSSELGDDLDAMAEKLEVSPRGLRLRMRQLGL